MSTLRLISILFRFILPHIAGSCIDFSAIGHQQLYVCRIVASCCTMKGCPTLNYTTQRTEINISFEGLHPLVMLFHCVSWCQGQRGLACLQVLPLQTDRLQEGIG